jgi:uncharacterized protein YndB with AHSA1/START domain
MSAHAPAVSTPDGELRKNDDGYIIVFERELNHSREAVYAALTESRRLAAWEHPVEYLPELREGATIYAQLNPQAKVFALGRVLTVSPPRAFAFRWTTNNPTLPPELTMSWTVEPSSAASRARLEAGPFGTDYQLIPFMASIHIHLDHLDEAIRTPEEELPSPPWSEISVVTRSGRMAEMVGAYDAKIRPVYPELPPLRTPGGAGGTGAPPRP